MRGFDRWPGSFQRSILCLKKYSSAFSWLCEMRMRGGENSRVSTAAVGCTHLLQLLALIMSLQGSRVGTDARRPRVMPAGGRSETELTLARQPDSEACQAQRQAQQTHHRKRAACLWQFRRRGLRSTRRR